MRDKKISPGLHGAIRADCPNTLCCNTELYLHPKNRVYCPQCSKFFKLTELNLGGDDVLEK